MEPYKNTLGLRDKDEPVLFVLDKTGKVIFMAYGAFRQRLLSEIGALVEN
jgi:predicted transcriptional regulator